jgi:tetratricopeptide (TPR) repeat protein
MTTEDDYLLHDDAETQNIHEKLKNLLESNDEASLRLAFQLIQGGGTPQILHTHLTVLAIFHTDDSVRQEAKSLLKNAKPALLAHIDAHVWNPYHLYEYHEQDMDKFLRTITQHPEIDKSNFANFVLHLTGKGALFCLKNHTAPEHFIIAQLIDDNAYLSLDYFDLQTLPTAIGDFPQIRSLSVEGNPLQTLPESLAHLKHLEYLYFTPDTVSRQVIELFEQFFPLIMAERYYEEAWQLVNQLSYHEAKQSIQKSCILRPDFPTYWDTLSWVLVGLQQYHEALEALDKGLGALQEIKDKTIYHANKGSIWLRMNAPEEARKEADITDSLLAQIPKKEWTAHQYFAKGLTAYIVGDFEAAHHFYNETIREDYYYGGGACWYNKACVYAKQHEKESMLDALQKALEAGRIYWVREAPLDVDFQEYWQDEDFKKLMKWKR